MDFPGSRHFMDQSSKRLFPRRSKIKSGWSRLLTVSAPLGLVRNCWHLKRKGRAVVQTGRYREEAEGSSSRSAFGYPGAIETRFTYGLEEAYMPKPPGPNEFTYSTACQTSASGH